MYKCDRCGEVFDRPETRYGEAVEFWGAIYREPFNACPCCGWDEYEEVKDEDLGN